MKIKLLNKKDSYVTSESIINNIADKYFNNDIFKAEQEFNKMFNQGYFKEYKKRG